MSLFSHQNTCHNFQAAMFERSYGKQQGEIDTRVRVGVFKTHLSYFKAVLSI